MEKCTSDLGPYRATKLWNDVIRTFRTSIPVGRHRRHMRNYENCFTATEAIDWLFSYLGKNPEFGPEVTRVQTLQLLRKFYKSGVFENIRGTKPVRSEDFKDNGDLYRVTFNSPLRILRTPRRAPLVTRSNTAPTNESNDIERILNKEAELIPAALPECHLIARQLTVQDTEDVWKSVVLNRLQIALGLPNLDAILDVSSVNPQHIIHNATRIGKNDVVMVLDKANDLPHWVLSAMKCLVNWPNASGTGSCLPNYPGFEGDVFKVVKDYFCNLGIPLSTYAMYDVFINVLVRAEYLDIGPWTPASTSFCSYAPAQVSSFEFVDSFLVQVMEKSSNSNSVIHKTSTPCCWKTPMCRGCGTTSINSSSAGGNSENADEQYMAMSHIMAKNLPSNLCYETEFASASPKTRIIPHENVFCPTSLGRTASCRGNLRLNENSGLPRCQSALDAPSPRRENHNAVRYRSCGDVKEVINNTQPVNRIATNSQPESETCSIASHAQVDHNYNKPYVQDNSRIVRRLRSRSGGYHNLGYLNLEDLRSSPSSASSYHTAETVPATETYTTVQLPPKPNELHRDGRRENLCLSSSVSTLYSSAIDDQESDFYVPKATSQSTWELSPRSNFEKNIYFTESLRKYDSSPNLFSERGKRCAVEVLQLVALLLPPGNRRKLHLLLKFMSKVCQNGSLSLCNSVTNRALVLQTFLRCIVNADSEADYDELLAIRLVMFLMDNHQEIFRVPCMVKTQVEERIIFLNREKIHYTLDDPSSITYCEQVSKVEYENQRLTHSERALVGLLDGIMNDKRLSQKEKKKRLKQFKEAYPKIHAERFPPTDEGGAFPVQNKQSFKPTILQKLRNMRM